MESDTIDIKIIKESFIVIAKCENCNFKRYNISITNDHFSNNAGFQTLQHLVKHTDHIISVNGKKYKINKTLDSIIEVWIIITVC